MATAPIDARDDDEQNVRIDASVTVNSDREIAPRPDSAAATAEEASTHKSAKTHAGNGSLYLSLKLKSKTLV